MIELVAELGAKTRGVGGGLPDPPPHPATTEARAIPRTAEHAELDGNRKIMRINLDGHEYHG